MRKNGFGISIALAILSMVVALAAAHGQQNKLEPSATAKTATGSATPVKQPSKKLNPDQLYKVNCTRCHSEVPTMDERRTATIMRHMRVRANIPQDDAEAIFEYLKK